MKKFFVIGMALVILCTSIGCGLNKGRGDAWKDKFGGDDNEIVRYVEYAYGDNCWADYTFKGDLDGADFSNIQTLDGKDIDDCFIIVIVYDENDRVEGCFAT